MNADVLLAEIEDLVRNEPGVERFQYFDDDVIDWYARLKAISPYLHISVRTDLAAGLVTARGNYDGLNGYFTLITALKAAAYMLRLENAKPMSVGLDKGTGHEYFDAVRKLVQSAKTKLFFVDPFFSEEVVSFYFPYIAESAKTVRVMTKDNTSTITPSLMKFAQQSSKKCELRRAKIHDRMLFVDSDGCHLSGTSFKEGSQNHPTSIIQVLDFKVLRDQYQKIWDEAEVVI